MRKKRKMKQKALRSFIFSQIGHRGHANTVGHVCLPDESILISEKSGEVILYKDGNKTEIQGVPDVYVRGQGGLLDLELHPNFAENKWVYMSYASEEGPEKGGHTAIARARLNGNQFTDLQVLYKAIPILPRGSILDPVLNSTMTAISISR